jgi:hypothetical protein
VGAPAGSRRGYPTARWNTVHIAKIVRSLEARGDVVARADLARVSPLAHAHVIPGATYRFPSKNEVSAI